MDLSLFEYVKDYIEVQMGDDLMPHYPLKNRSASLVEEKIDVSSFNVKLTEDENVNVATKESRERQRKKLILRAKNFSDGVDFFKTFKYIDISFLKDEGNNWNYFDKPNKAQLLNLMASIESVGIFTPLIVVPRGDGFFNVLIGHSRVKALHNLYKSTNNERYMFAPCFIIEEEMEEYFIRSLMIDSNIPYRCVSRDVYIKAIFERHELLSRTKTYRNEVNIAQAIADELGISTATVFNYLTLKKLCKEAMTLICDKDITLQCGRCLAGLKLEDQLYILENVTLEDLNTPYKIKYLTAERRPSGNELKARVKRVKTLVPFQTPVQINVSPELLNKFLVYAVDFKKVEIPNLLSDYGKKHVHKHFDIKLDKDHMKFYLKANIIDEDLLRKVYTTNLEEIMRV